MYAYLIFYLCKFAVYDDDDDDDDGWCFTATFVQMAG